MENQLALFLTYKDVAERLGIKTESVRRYRKRGSMPPPDGQFGSTPYWLHTTIDEYIDNRGRKVKKDGQDELPVQP